MQLLKNSHWEQTRMKDNVYVFDFDGTLTTCDTFPRFITFARGRLAFIAGFTLFSPLLVLMKMRLLSNWRVKQWLFSLYFKGMAECDFNHLCEMFAKTNSCILRKKGIKEMERALCSDATVMVVSASIDNWVRPFFNDKRVIVIGTEVEISSGRLTGRFKTHNCYGPEKVRRIEQLLPNRKDYRLTAFGDSRGDSELLAFADESYYKPFK